MLKSFERWSKGHPTLPCSEQNVGIFTSKTGHEFALLEEYVRSGVNHPAYSREDKGVFKTALAALEK